MQAQKSPMLDKGVFGRSTFGVKLTTVLHTTNGTPFRVSVADLPKLKGWSFRILNGYVFAYKAISLGRLLLGVGNSGRGNQAPVVVDHKDRDRLNNTRGNLRLATRSQNNSNIQVHNLTGWRGVSQQPNGRFHAKIRHNGKRRHLGAFATAEEAGKAYQAEAKKLFGNFRGEAKAKKPVAD